MFSPLKEYLFGLPNCPDTIRKFLNRGDALSWLHFVESQLKSSNEYILKSESKKVASFEVAAEVSMLRIKIENRKNNLFIPSAAQQLFVGFTEKEKKYCSGYVKIFYRTLSQYLEKWSKSLDGTEIFSWMDLTSPPDWTKLVEPSLQFFSKRFNDTVINNDSAYDETYLLCQLIEENSTEWSLKKVTSDERWLEIFKTLGQQNRSIVKLSNLVEYAFSLPGSSTEVERLFSIINDVWGPDKPHLKLETLEAYLNIKVNSDLNCSEYYNSIKDNKRLLSQVLSQFKNIRI